MSEKCLSCEHIPCVNFQRVEKNTEKEIEGGELFLLEETAKRAIPLPFGCVGTPLYVVCQLCAATFELVGEDEPDSPLVLLAWQCLYDLKCSLFLALSGHYRGAMQLLRPPLETLLSGLYWQWRAIEIGDEEAAKQFNCAYEAWQQGHYRLSDEERIFAFGIGQRQTASVSLDFRFVVHFAKEKGFINEHGVGLISGLWESLNPFLHSQFKKMEVYRKFYAVSVRESICSSCPGLVRYSEDRFRSWLGPFQQVIALIIDSILLFYPKVTQTKLGGDAFGLLKSLEWLDKEFGLKVVQDPVLRKLLKELEIDWQPEDGQ